MDKETIILLLVIIGTTLIAILYAALLLRRIGKLRANHSKIEEIASYIREGTVAYLKRQYKMIALFVVGVAIVLAALGFIPALQKAEGIGWRAAICFVIGATFSGFAGFIGMQAGTKANSLTAAAANSSGMSKALKMAFSGGSILGLSVVGFSLLGLTGLLLIFLVINNDYAATIQIVTGYGLGASLVALFARVGGGIYTKAADVGADLVGKLELNIPEDDPRNPAVIADNVGDNVGDIAGMGSDLLESYAGSIISAITLGIFLVAYNPSLTESSLTLFPLLVAAAGIISTLISVIFVRLREWNNPQKTLRIATYIAAGIVLICSMILSYVFFNDIRPFIAIAAGLFAGIAIGLIAEFYTSDTSKHVLHIAHQSQTGHATNIIAGYAIGMKSTALTILALMGGVVISYMVTRENYDMYGIALAAVGMLSTVGITVAVDGYGPISDNAGGIAQMANLDKKTRQITDKLDSVGNTTAAIGKGFCIGSATLTSLALFVAFAHAAGISVINMITPIVIVGVLIGAMLPFLFTAVTIDSVGNAANKMIDEVRRQFAEDPGIMEGTSKPDYGRCVDISTKAALREMILPGLIAVLSPIIIGFLFGVEALGGLLLGSLASGSMLAIFMANSGGAWDNAKKVIEAGLFGGKGSNAHKAAVTGDTVGDPFKDTAGPAMDILIKLMAIISLIIGPAITEIGSLLGRFF